MVADNGRRSVLDEGLKQLIEAPRMALDKSQALRDLFDRFASDCTLETRELSAAPCSIKLNGMSSGTAWHLLVTYQAGFACVFHCPQWEQPLVIGCDRRFAHSLLEAMYGGDGSEPAPEQFPVPTGLESGLFREILTRHAAVLGRQFNASFALERSETSLEPSELGVADAPSVIAQFNFRILNGGGSLFVLLPTGPVSSFRQRGGSESPAESNKQDAAWSIQLQQVLGSAGVDLRAVLDGSHMTVKELGSLRPGQILRLSSSLSSPVRLEAEDRTVFTASLRQSDGFFTVCIEGRFDEREQLLSDLIGAR